MPAMPPAGGEAGTYRGVDDADVLRPEPLSRRTDQGPGGLGGGGDIGVNQTHARKADRPGGLGKEAVARIGARSAGGFVPSGGQRDFGGDGKIPTIGVGPCAVWIKELIKVPVFSAGVGPSRESSTQE